MKEIKPGNVIPPVEYEERGFCPMINGPCKKLQCIAWEPTNQRCKFVRWA
jgi:hypothetical protein